MNERIRGTIKNWKDNGYGFLEVEGQRDIFIHFTAIQNRTGSEIAVGTEIEFEIIPGRKEGQLQAANAMVI